MKVKIDSIIYDSDSTPIMLILSQEEKEEIGSMQQESTCYCKHPDLSQKAVEQFMDINANKGGVVTNATLAKPSPLDDLDVEEPNYNCQETEEWTER